VEMIIKVCVVACVVEVWFFGNCEG